jgi:hypothetical protein
MSPPSLATAGRTRVSISSLICATISASSGLSPKSALSAGTREAGRSHVEQRHVRSEMIEQDAEHVGLGVAPVRTGRDRHRDEVAAEEHAGHVTQGEQRLGERRGLGLLRARKVAGARFHDRAAGQEFERVAGLGVASVSINMPAIWAPRELIDIAQVPGGDELRLFRRGADFMIVLDRNELMNSRMSGSEEALATMTHRAAAERKAPQVLIGGYGMGFTLRAALAMLPADAQVVVAELVPQIIDWARGPMAELPPAASTIRASIV